MKGYIKILIYPKSVKALNVYYYIKENNCK